MRGATRNLWNAIKRETGAHFEQFVSDRRVQSWWRNASIRICERISDLALRAADRIRGAQPEPAASMDHLHRTATEYHRRPPTPSGGPDQGTTGRKAPAPRTGTADQPGHLRRTPAEPSHVPRHGR
ncbi:hypothetical protein [Streptomyces parvus]|uniref:hypothetical protein n=1 Tax=Streptomyces parvus TaxID=66428 RepID=UPI0035DAC518